MFNNINPEFSGQIITPQKKPVTGTPVAPPSESPGSALDGETNNQKNKEGNPKAPALTPQHGPDRKDQGIGINLDSFF